MSTFAGIPVAVELASGNVAPLLHEIGHALERLVGLGEPSILDLRGVPLAPGEEGRILEFLGTGEVHAELEAGGRSTVNESRFPGVWVVTHHDPAGEIVGRLIEITFVPDIIRSHAEEVRDSRERIAREVQFMSGTAAPRQTAPNTNGEATPGVLED